MERQKKFTPGPWSVLESDELEGDYNVCDENLDEVMLGPVCKDEVETLANCFLTAAAPELLESLEWAIENISDDTSMFGLKKCMEAIAKAYGEEAENK